MCYAFFKNNFTQLFIANHTHKRTWYSMAGAIGCGNNYFLIFFKESVIIATYHVFWHINNKIIAQRGGENIVGRKNGLLNFFSVMYTICNVFISFFKFI